MLKIKSELDLINLMQHELIKNANNQDFSNLEQAVNYLDSAIDVLDAHGFANEANKLLNILTKIAASSRQVLLNIDNAPLKFIKKLQDRRYPIDDYLRIIEDKNIDIDTKEKIKLKINQDVRNTDKSLIEIVADILNLGHENPSEEDFRRVLGPKIYMPINEVRAKSYYKPIPGIKQMSIKDFMRYKAKNPSMKTDIPAPPFNPNELSMPTGIRPPFETPPGIFDKPFTTSAAKKYKPKNPTNVSKRHSEKFVKNLKETGTMFSKKDFNMADDLLDSDIDFEDEDDPEYQKY